MKISKLFQNLCFTNKLFFRVIFFLFLISPFVNKAENKLFLSNNYDLSNNFTSNPFSDYFKSLLLIPDQTKTICSDEPLGVSFDFTNNSGVPFPGYDFIIYNL
jgi:hypothetical protein